MKIRTHYCPACGADKGHNLAGCQNAKGLRSVINCQREEIDSLMDETRSLRDREKAADEQGQQAEAWKDQCGFLARVSTALLDLLDKHKQGGTR